MRKVPATSQDSQEFFHHGDSTIAPVAVHHLAGQIHRNERTNTIRICGRIPLEWVDGLSGIHRALFSSGQKAGTF